MASGGPLLHDRASLRFRTICNAVWKTSRRLNTDVLLGNLSPFGTSHLCMNVLRAKVLEFMAVLHNSETFGDKTNIARMIPFKVRVVSTARHGVPRVLRNGMVSLLYWFERIYLKPKQKTPSSVYRAHAQPRFRAKT